ncbi:hypothetical protein [Parvibaculum sp.]|uniref:hypothetical protein n=1 Tax=Parvibaculum sp. TaxID=2024848 RepID=UPI001B176D66|nr:hypothetical protein [Parvibaculum sp.]MBO6633620.1 hypothetical protein [Parvibaculum sp.]MBO6679567.1 hypothetical protein [Parvibaculum sp.]MBO6686520.1 hypothetical protein [Parvibaculum sp.]MBO6905318.1 hypothetical protein [Parvibaculum sp.]
MVVLCAMVMALGAVGWALVAALPRFRAVVFRQVAGKFVRSIGHWRTDRARLDGEALGRGAALSSRRRQIHIVTWSKYGSTQGSKP